MVFEHRLFPGGAVGVVRMGRVAACVAAAFFSPASMSAAQESLREDATAAPAPNETRTSVPGETLSVHLLTVGPGDRVEELFGHNVLLIRDSATGSEQAFNYGLYDPNESGFLLNFFKGRMMYRVAPLPLDYSLASYRAAGRRVWAQELDLEPAARLRLRDLLVTASLPENSFYRYEYFLNNCSTKLRDVLDVVLDGQLRAATDSADDSGVSWRYHTRRLTAGKLHFFAGIDLLLGPRGDESTTTWQEMWVPMKLRDTLGAFYITRSDGSRTRLVRSEAIWVESERTSEPATSRSMELLFMFFGTGVGLLFVIIGRRSASASRGGRLGLVIAGCLWGTFCFVTGAVLVAMHWTDHEFMYWNRNFLLFSPLGLGVAVGLVRVARRGTTGLWGRRFALGSLGLTIVALVLYLIPAVRQENLVMIAFALPVHLAVCWVMLGIHKMDHTLVYDPTFQPGR